MSLSDIKVKAKNKKSKRLGRGTGSGKGKTSGRGHKGAGQRKGKQLPYEGFTGGSLPLYRIIPKRGFNSPCRKVYQIVNLFDIQKIVKEDCEVGPELLRKNNLIKNDKKPIKILAKTKDKFTVKATFKADKFSAKAIELIESAGGKAECLSR